MHFRYRSAKLFPLALTLLLALSAVPDVRAQAPSPTPPPSPQERALLQAELLKLGDVEPSAEALERIAAAIEASRRQKLRLTETQKKVSPLLRQLAESDGHPGRAGGALRTGPAASEPMPPLLQIDERGNVLVEIRVGGAADVGALRALGASIQATAPEAGLVVAWVPAGRVMEVAELASVQGVHPVPPAATRIGAVTTEGVEALNVDEVREVFGLDGTGVKTCVLSDGILGLEEAQATGDLPAVEACPIFPTDAGAEGTAMLEIVHDLAPGAELAFCSALFDGKPGYVEAINYLANDAFGGTGCDVIVDDVAYLTEPYFQDGIIAQAVDAAAAQGVAFFSAAGNSADNHYERPYVDATPGSVGDIPAPFADLHDFGRAAGLDSDVDWTGIVAGAGTQVNVWLQWNDPFDASSNDYDLYLFDRLGFLVGNPDPDTLGLFPCPAPETFCLGLTGTAVQDGDDAPLEVAVVFNPYGGDDPFAEIEPFFIVIDRFFGDPDKLLEINFNSNNGLFAVSTTYNVPEGSIWGHPAAEGSIAVGAIDVSDPSLDEIEEFSSRGPSLIFFNPDGTPNFQSRPKPDVVAVDGVSVTGFGGFPSTFFGTSAAAPHAAAVGALLLDFDPDLSPEAVEEILEETARDRGAPGFDIIYGHGLISAFDAIVGAIDDEAAPACEIVSVEGGTLTVEVQDVGIGLDRIEQRRATNATLAIPDFARGTDEPVRFTATKINPDKGSTVIVEVFDVGGNSVTCDPVVTTLASEVPETFELGANYPNPFNPTTKITFKLPEAAPVDLTVYDVAGREVAVLVRDRMEPGTFEVQWDGRDNAGRVLPSGMYLYRLNAGAFTESRTMVLLK